MIEYTYIRITKAHRQALRKMMLYQRETYDEVIERLIYEVVCFKSQVKP